MQAIDAADIDARGCTVNYEIGDPLERLVGEPDRFGEVIAGA